MAPGNYVSVSTGLSLLILGVILLVGICNAKEIPIRYTKYVDCGFAGYKPGGGPKEVKDINKTISELAARQLLAVINPKELLALDHSLSYHLDDESEFYSGLIDHCPKLAPALGRFGNVQDAIMRHMKPKAQDILDAANEAMGKLTKDCSEKMNNIKDYVEKSIIDHEKKLVSRQFQGSFDLWVGCLDEPNEEEVNECQRDAYGDAKALKPDFAVFGSELFSAKHLSGDQVRELEAYLLPARNYANLLIMMLKPLIDVYANDTTSDGQYYYKKYKRHLRNHVDYYTEYFNLAVQAIVSFWEGNVPGERPCSKEDDVKCTGANHASEGLSAMTRTLTNEFVCSCRIDGVQQVCDLHLEVHTEGDFNRSEYKTFTGDEDEIVRNYGSRLLQKLRGAYEKESGPVIKEYWNTEVLSFKKIWKEAKDMAAQTQEEEDNEKLDESSKLNRNLEGFSSHYTQRKAKAEFVTTSNRFFKEQEKPEQSKLVPPPAADLDVGEPNTATTTSDT